MLVLMVPVFAAPPTKLWGVTRPILRGAGSDLSLPAAPASFGGLVVAGRGGHPQTFIDVDHRAERAFLRAAVLVIFGVWAWCRSLVIYGSLKPQMCLTFCSSVRIIISFHYVLVVVYDVDKQEKDPLWLLVPRASE